MDTKFDISLYNDEFFAWHAKHVHVPCVMMGMKLHLEFQMHSMCDFGCGIGSFLKGAWQAGVERIKGYELGGEDAKRYTDPIVQPFIDFNTDLTKADIQDEPYEITLCTEVAEHIETRHSGRLVKTIADNTKGFCIFTAAHVGQEGTGHINCQPQEFWVKHFEDNGMKKSDEMTDTIIRLWHDAPTYYLPNLIVFTK